jgi:hypothetical protein
LLHAVDLVDLEAFLVEEDIEYLICAYCQPSPALGVCKCELTASVCCRNMQNTVAYSIPCAIEYLRDQFGGLAA